MYISTTGFSTQQGFSTQKKNVYIYIYLQHARDIFQRIQKSEEWNDVAKSQPFIRFLVSFKHFHPWGVVSGSKQRFKCGLKKMMNMMF